jgi:hypothetical protein
MLLREGGSRFSLSVRKTERQLHEREKVRETNVCMREMETVVCVYVKERRVNVHL